MMMRVGSSFCLSFLDMYSISLGLLLKSITSPCEKKSQDQLNYVAIAVAVYITLIVFCWSVWIMHTGVAYCKISGMTLYDIGINISFPLSLR